MENETNMTSLKAEDGQISDTDDVPDETDDWYEVDDDDYLDVTSDQAPPTDQTHENQIQECDQPTLNGQADVEESTQNNIEESELELITKSDFRYTNSRELIPSEKIATSLSQFFNLIRSAIGKELWRVTMPIHFNEPLSLMQRICEDLEYVYLLNQAADCKDSLKRLVYITAFAVSPFSTTIGRHSKPFNPLLGETYELIDENLDYCCFCEQVSHHPPILAIHCEGRDWKFWQEYKFDSKFRGQFLRLSPTGDVHVQFKDNQHHYSWNRPDTIVHNLLVGSMWVDQDGEAKVINHQTQESSAMIYESYNKVGRNYKNVKCLVRDVNDKIEFELNGMWDSYLDCTVISDRKTKRLWTVAERPSNSAKMYGFTKFAMKLNQPQEGVCPTDSRCRPDQRLMEEGKILEASKEKHRLEEKQRAARRYRIDENIEYKPRWFKMKTDPDTGKSYHMYVGGYWKARLEQTFTKIPALF